MNTQSTLISIHLLTNKQNHSIPTLQSYQHLVQSHLHSVFTLSLLFTCRSYKYFHVWYRSFIYTPETNLLLQIWYRTFVHTYLNQILFYSSGTSWSTLLQLCLLQISTCTLQFCSVSVLVQIYVHFCNRPTRHHCCIRHEYFWQRRLLIADQWNYAKVTLVNLTVSVERRGGGVCKLRREGRLLSHWQLENTKMKW